MTWLRRLGAVFLGLALALAALEAALRIAAAATEAQRPAPAPDGRSIVLFVGDSNVYGFHVEADQTLPAHAQRLSEELSPPGFLSVNRGRPGSPSWIALEEACRALERFRPATLVARVGINNRILVPPSRASWLEGLRIVRLARITFRNLADASARRSGGPMEEAIGDHGLRIRTPPRDGERPDAFDVEHAGREQEYAAEVRPTLRADLSAIAAAAARAGAKVVFAGYLDGSGPYADVNADLAWAARASDGLFVDLAALGRRAIAARGREEILFADGHPTAVGYGLEARELLRALGVSPSDPMDWLASRPRLDVPRVEIELLDGPGLAFRVRSAPNANGMLLVGRPGKSFLEKGACEVPLAEDADDPILAGALAAQEMKFRLDARGEARVDVPAALAARLPRGALAAAVVVFFDGARARRMTASPALELPKEKTR